MTGVWLLISGYYY